ncbi:MAG TPA: FAD:protein FMN transferase, partial [Telluria sp.]|nr:FAD:protein FMN transferase [Telluria sp.]
MRRRARPLLGTLVDVTVASAPAHIDVDGAIEAAFAAVALTHRLMSFHDSGSDVARLNRAAPGAVVAVDAHTWNVLALAQRMFDTSGGVFNAACAPRLVEWDCLPAPEQVRPAYAAQADVYALDEDNRVRKLGPGWIDLG